MIVILHLHFSHMFFSFQRILGGFPVRLHVPFLTVKWRASETTFSILSLSTYISLLSIYISFVSLSLLAVRLVSLPLCLLFLFSLSALSLSLSAFSFSSLCPPCLSLVLLFLSSPSLLSLSSLSLFCTSRHRTYVSQGFPRSIVLCFCLSLSCSAMRLLSLGAATALLGNSGEKGDTDMKISSWASRA